MNQSGSSEAVNAELVAEVRTVARTFANGRSTVRALRGVDLCLQAGRMVALQGRSGAGKTTLLNILVGLDDPTTGEVWLLGRNLAALSEPLRAQLRRESVGLMFQHAHLFPLLTAQENVEIALRLQRVLPTARRERASQALAQVNLQQRAHHRGVELSGGEQQRVALARALVHAPRLLVADEPTGNLDTRTARELAWLLVILAHEHRIGMLVATHDANITAVADIVLDLRDGKLGTPYDNL
jgi:putative ABC transport system ATP-binding protein